MERKAGAIYLVPTHQELFECVRTKFEHEHPRRSSGRNSPGKAKAIYTTAVTQQTQSRAWRASALTMVDDDSSTDSLSEYKTLWLRAQSPELSRSRAAVFSALPCK